MQEGSELVGSLVWTFLLPITRGAWFQLAVTRTTCWVKYPTSHFGSLFALDRRGKIDVAQRN